MNLRDTVTNIHDGAIKLTKYVKKIGVKLIIFGLLIIVPNFILKDFFKFDFIIEYFSEVSPTDKIAILTFYVLVFGFVYHQGFRLASEEKYHLVRHVPGFNDEVTKNGGLFLFFIILAIVFSSSSNYWWILIFIILNSILVFFLGFFNEYCAKNENRVTLKFIGDEPIPNLELYQTTNLDYHFKDEKNEFIIPLEQVKEIKFNNIKMSDSKKYKSFEDLPEHIGKKYKKLIISSKPMFYEPNPSYNLNFDDFSNYVFEV